MSKDHSGEPGSERSPAEASLSQGRSKVRDRVHRSLIERFVDEMEADHPAKASLAAQNPSLAPSPAPAPLAPLAPGNAAALPPQPDSVQISGPQADNVEPLPISFGKRLAQRGAGMAAPVVPRKHVEINLPELKRAGFVTPDAERSTTVEEFRAIKRPLLRNAMAGLASGNSLDHVILVTSATENEGKTFVAINLAMSIAAERGLNVLLMDADVVKRDVPRRLNFRAKTGFMDLLVNPEMDLADVMVRTNVPDLTILPSGSQETNTTELLAGPEMERLMVDLATRYSDRVIIIDTPPVLLTTETPVLAAHVGQVALVIEAERTTRTEVKKSIELLGACPNVNLILNKVKDIHSGDYNYYGYYRSDDDESDVPENSGGVRAAE